MKITILPGEAEEYAASSDIRTGIESDEAYRKRLLTTGLAKYRAVEILAGSELDAIGKEHGMVRIHTHRAA